MYKYTYYNIYCLKILIMEKALEISKLLSGKITAIRKKRLNGEMVDEYKDKVPRNVLNLIADGKKVIIRKRYSNGQIVSEHIYVRGEPHGVHKQWFKNGQMEWEHPYVHGKSHGVWKDWYMNGRLKRVRVFWCGFATGVWQSFDERREISRYTDWLTLNRNNAKITQLKD